MSEPTVESLQKELKAAQTALEEAGKGGMSKEDQERLTFLEGDHKKLIEARDKLKKEKTIAEEAALLKNGEFEKLAQTKTAEVEDLTAKLEGLTKTIEAYTVRDEEEFKAILEGVPEALREQVSDETLPLAKRLSLAKALSTVKGKPPGYREPGEQDPTTLQAQYDAAVKSKNMMEQLRLKREIHEARE